ncbi:MAG: hypothetical protein K1V69_03640, partial [Alistipes sp.]
MSKNIAFIIIGKDTYKPSEKSKLACFFSEAQYLRRSQSTKSRGQKQAKGLIMPRRSIFDEVKDRDRRGQKQVYPDFAGREYLGRSQDTEIAGGGRTRTAPAPALHLHPHCTCTHT